MKKRRRGYDSQGEESDERGNNILKVCWDSDVHFSHFSRQTAMRNQVKNPELPNRKKRNLLKTKMMLSKVLLSR